MKKKVLGVACALLIGAVSLAGCGGGADNGGKYELPYHQQSGKELNESLYYRNDLETAACDPSILWVSKEQDPVYGGYFYLYPSSDSELFYKGVAVYRSKDMSDWEYLGPAYYPRTGSYWATLGMMAPETVYDAQDGKYYMYFSGAESRSVYFNSHADKQAYYAVETEVKDTYTSFEGASAAVEEYRNADEDEYSETQLEEITEILSSYDVAVEEAGSDAEKMTEAKDALIALKRVKIPKKEYLKSRYGLGVAVSDNPVGPFVEYTNDSEDENYDPEKRTIKLGDPFICHEDFAEGGADLGGKVEEGGKLMIGMDVSPFEDPKTHDKYLYFSNPYLRQEYIYAVKVGKHWTDDPKWDTLTPVLRQGYTTVDGNTKTDYHMNTNINEAPHAYYDAASDQYYLTFTFDGAWNKNYSVAQAIGKSPTGPFTKIHEADGGVILSANQLWDHVSGPGHCCFITYKDKLYISYQGIYNRLAILGDTYSSKRGICADEINFITNGNGQKIMYANGPTFAPMPKIGPDAVYENIAKSATVIAKNGENQTALNDGLITYTLAHDLVKEFDAKKGTTEITLSFEDYRTIRSIMVFNSKNIETMFDKVDRIELDFKKTDASGNNMEGTAYMENLLFDTELYTTHWDGSDDGIDTMARPGGSVAVEFDELQVKSIRITIKSDKPISISEIMVLGK